MKGAHALAWCKLFVYSISIFMLLVKIRVVLLIALNTSRLSLDLSATVGTGSQCQLQEVTELVSGDFSALVSRQGYGGEVEEAVHFLRFKHTVESATGASQRFCTVTAHERPTPPH